MYDLFPPISRPYIEHCQFSSWHPTFAQVSPRATIIRPLSIGFRWYLEEDGVIVPDGSEDFPLTSSLSDKSDSDAEADEDVPRKIYAFPELDAQIRDAIACYGAVFPKLNWTSPKDAAWVLPTLKCTSPVDVYLLLKSSDFISHDLNPSLAFEGCCLQELEEQPHLHDLELVLKKWYAVDHSREFRCFVRNETLLGISQRDFNYYPHLNERGTKSRVLSCVSEFWVTYIQAKFGGGGDYIFDIHLTRDLSSAHLLDINPYHPKTDSLLFTYEDLRELLVVSHNPLCSGTTKNLSPISSFVPVLRVITSPSDSAATRNAPTYQHNAVPFDVLQMSSGFDMNTFASRWEEELKRTQENDDTLSDFEG